MENYLMVLQFTRHKVQSFGVNFSLFSLSCILFLKISPGNSGCSAMDTKYHSLRQQIETETGTDCSTIFWKLKKRQDSVFFVIICMNLLFAWSFWLGWKQLGARYERSGRRLTGGRPGTWTPRSASEGSERSSRPVSRRTPGENERGMYYVISAVLTPTCVHPVLIRGSGHNSPEAGSERGQVWEEFWPRLGGVRGHTGTEAAGEQLTGDWSEDIILWGWRPGLLTCAEQTGW